MAFTSINGACTGFEPGNSEVIPDANVGLNPTFFTMRTANPTPHTGTYCGRVQYRGYIRWAVSGSEIYVGMWLNPSSANSGFWEADAAAIEAELADGKIVDIRWNIATHAFDAYVDNVLVASGGVQVDDAWFLIEIRFEIGAAGNIETRIDGVGDISYAGDTQPDVSATIVYINLVGTPGFTVSYIYVDDVSIGTGGWPGDRRYVLLRPNADDTAQWTPSVGADNYAMVDEVPPSDTDYVESDTDGQQDKYDMTDWDGTEKTPVAVVTWARAKKSEGLDHRLKLILDDGIAEDVGPAEILLTDYTYISRVDDTAPSGAIWSDPLVDALIAGIESQIV